jgi:hypothetical protein
MGGLLALQEIIQQSSIDSIDNITVLVDTLKCQYGDFDKQTTHFNFCLLSN